MRVVISLKRAWRRRGLFLVLCGVIALNYSGRCSAEIVFLALGDSVTYGLDPSDSSTFVPSLADQGFVRPFADHLATRHGGARPLVKNLAIPGELSSSFFSGAAPAGWFNRFPPLNSNYGTPPESQHQLMLSSIDDIFNAGNSVGYVSILLGSNDVFYLTSTSEFQNATATEQQQLVAQTLGEIFENYNALLMDVRARLPDAEIFLPNYFNPYAENMPESPFYEQVLATFNPAVEQLAGAYGAKYVDLYSVFDGRQLELTNIGTTLRDVHPNQLGYQAAAGAFISVVPEPTAAWLVVAMTGVLLSTRRSRRSGTLQSVVA